MVFPGLKTRELSPQVASGQREPDRAHEAQPWEWTRKRSCFAGAANHPAPLSKITAAGIANEVPLVASESCSSSIRRRSGEVSREGQIKGCDPIGQGRTDVGIGVAAQRKPLGGGTAVYRIDHQLSHLDGIALHRKRTGRESTAHFADWSILVDGHRRRTDNATSKARVGGARFDDRELDAEKCDFLGDRLNEAFDRPFGRVIQAEIRIGDLATL
jgi:hypothetical protein